MVDPNFLAQCVTDFKRPADLIPNALGVRDPNATLKAANATLISTQIARDSLAKYRYRAKQYDPLSSMPGVRRQKARELLDQGLVPPLEGGYQFVIDRRPEGEEDQLIPSVEYTAYFSRREVPIADKDHKEHEHDLGHVPTFQDMFSCVVFGDVVQQAASNSLGDVEACKRFTKAMDSFGDDLRNLDYVEYFYNSDASLRRSGIVQSARRNLQSLLLMSTPPVLGNSKIKDKRDKLLTDLWGLLGLDYHEDIAANEAKQAGQHPHVSRDRFNRNWEGELTPQDYNGEGAGTNKYFKPEKLAALSALVRIENIAA